MRRLLPLALTAGLFLTVPSVAAAASTDPLVRVQATVETPANFDDDAGGGADTDDPAIWINRKDPGASRVIATVKNSGLQVYDLSGHQVQAIPAPPAPGPDDEPGRFNNVDILRDVTLGGRTVDLAVTTDRGRDQLRSYAIDQATGTLTDVTAANVPLAFARDQKQVNDQATAYGLAVFRGLDGAPYAVATRRNTTDIGLFRLSIADGRVSYQRTDTFSFPSTFTLPGGKTWSPCEDPGKGPQLEGLVVDPTTRTLYAAQEDVALWRMQVVGPTLVKAPSIVERTTTFGAPATYDAAADECVTTGPASSQAGRIVADVEGLTIYPTGLLSGTLLVSSQGDDTYYTYDRLTNRPLSHFAVVDGKVDGTQDTDGAAADPTPLPGFPNGLLAVQDGQNTPDVVVDGEPRPNTNLKFLDAGVLIGRPRA